MFCEETSGNVDYKKIKDNALIIDLDNNFNNNYNVDINLDDN